MTSNILTQERLKELFHYDPCTGISTRLISVSNAESNGRPAGSKDSNGYLRVSIDGERHKLHRLSFLYVTGRFPKHSTDHINGIRDDNRWKKLRDVTHKENARNAKMRNDSSSGIAGVGWHKGNEQWNARIGINGVQRNLGFFSDISDAEDARKSAELKYNFHPNHGRRA